MRKLLILGAGIYQVPLIKKAKEILGKKENKVYEVGRLVGIEDPAYFTHVFLKYEGETPSDYMTRQNRKNSLL